MGMSMSKAFSAGRIAAKKFNKTGEMPKNPYEQTEQPTEFVEWEDGFDSIAEY